MNTRKLFFLLLMLMLIWNGKGLSAANTTSSPQLVKRFDLPTVSSSPAQMIGVGNQLLFSADSTLDQRGWWLSNGYTIQPIKLPFSNQINNDVANPFITFDLYPADLLLLIDPKGDASGNWELRRSDNLQQSLYRGSGSLSSPYHFTLNNIAYFFISETLWQSDGTSGGTKPVIAVEPPAEPVMRWGNLIYYQSWDGAIWRSDGTANGSYEIISIFYKGEEADMLGVIDGAFYFIAYTYPINPYEMVTTVWRHVDGKNELVFERTGGEQLNGVVAQDWILLQTCLECVEQGAIWRIDESGATLIVEKASQQIDANNVVVRGNTIYFKGKDQKLWRIDDQPNSMRPVAPHAQYWDLNFYELNPPSDGANSAVYFIAKDVSTSHLVLWRSDGTSQGTFKLKELSDIGHITWATQQDRHLLIVIDRDRRWDSEGNELVEDRGQLWTSDGSVAGTIKLMSGGEISPPGQEGSSSPNWQTVNKGVIFTVRSGLDLWYTNYTVAGTQPLFKNIDSNKVKVVGSTIYFSADDGLHGSELWASDTTLKGTRLVQDLNASKVNSAWMRDFVAMGNRVCFKANLYELWCSDGTSQGTQLIAHPYSSSVAFNWQLYFTKNDELWRTNGTTNGTYQLKIPDTRVFSSSLTTVQGNTFYSLVVGPHLHSKLWRSDGTANGTTVIKDLGAAPPFHSPGNVNVVNGIVTFYAYDQSKGLELWRSDGSANGTSVIKDINPGEYGSKSPWYTIDVVGTGKQLFFTPYLNEVQRAQLWRSDSTASGTYNLNINAQWFGGLFPVGNVIYFQAIQPGVGYELWRSDGTPQGSYLVTDAVAPGWVSSFPMPLANLNGRLLFTAQDGQSNRDLWVTDGTEAGTKIVKKLGLTPLELPAFVLPSGSLAAQSYGNKVYFIKGNQLWETDGTDQGTVQLRHADGSFVAANDLIAVGNTLYFSHATQGNGERAELWKIVR